MNQGSYDGIEEEESRLVSSEGAAREVRENA